jgi:multiple sugar transport system permease protein
MAMTKKDIKDIALGLGFLLPNICGFLAFIAGPLLISLAMAFTNWNLELHNVFKTEPVKFVGFDNFIRLLNEPDFFRYLGNTLFFMMGIPFGIGGSLCSALLLSKNFKGDSRRIWLFAIATAGLVVSCGALLLLGLGGAAMTLLICGVTGTILVVGSIGGQSIYRTLFYFPHFTAGVATFILWKKLYSPETGPINNFLKPVLNHLAPYFSSLPPSGAHLISGALTLAIGLIFIYAVWRKYLLWRDGESGILCFILGIFVLSLPLIFACFWSTFKFATYLFPFLLVATIVFLVYILFSGRKHECPFDRGMANAIVVCGAVMVFCFILLGLSNVVFGLPQMASDGLEPPQWIADYYWAKPSLMVMGFWGAVGSNNMLLYLAGLSGVPQELYEAADIDGANSFQRFWHVTWPQLANVTFFILVMSVIGGLQGGFEMARTMTRGGPAGATTTLSYYIYTEGFATGRLGYASAVAWTLFALIFAVTAFNWKFGNRYTNE